MPAASAWCAAAAIAGQWAASHAALAKPPADCRKLRRVNASRSSGSCMAASCFAADGSCRRVAAASVVVLPRTSRRHISLRFANCGRCARRRGTPAPDGHRGLAAAGGHQARAVADEQIRHIVRAMILVDDRGRRDRCPCGRCRAGARRQRGSRRRRARSAWRRRLRMISAPRPAGTCAVARSSG